MKKFKELKEKFLVSKSEVLFDIQLQPENQCPNIDNAIANVVRAVKDIEGYCKDLNRIDNVDEAYSIANDIEWSVRTLDTAKDFENLRRSCENIRAWGQGWKDLAIELSEGKPVEDLLSDKFYLLLTT